MTVFNLKKGDKCIVKKINISGGERVRLNALGLKTGVQVHILGFSLFKSSALLAFGAVRVSMRKRLAEHIEVAK